MSNSLLTKNYTAESAVTKHRIVTDGATDYSAKQAVDSGTATFVGVSGTLDAATGERVDVILSGIADIEYGGTIARGDLLTSDALGKAVASVPAAGVNAFIIGRAVVSGIAGDIGSVFIIPAEIQG